jgi:hypothetical protein
MVPHVCTDATVSILCDRIGPISGKVTWIADDCFGVHFEPTLDAIDLLGVIKTVAAA